MFLRKNRSNKTGRTHLSIVQGYQDKDGKTKHRTIQPVGYLDVLEKEYDDPVTHFTRVAAELDAERKNKKSVNLTLDMDMQLARGTAQRKNYGHVVFSKGLCSGICMSGWWSNIIGRRIWSITMSRIITSK